MATKVACGAAGYDIRPLSSTRIFHPSADSKGRQIASTLIQLGAIDPVDGFTRSRQSHLMATKPGPPVEVKARQVIDFLRLPESAVGRADKQVIL